MATKVEPIELELDLGDGLPAATVTIGPKERANANASAPRFAAPALITITSTPVALTASYAHVHCANCGSDTRQFLGTFLESRLSNGVRVLQRKSLRELAAFAALPRRLDIAPPEAVEICPDCFVVERLFRTAIAAAQAQAELPFAGDVERPSNPAAVSVRSLAAGLEIEIEIEDTPTEPLPVIDLQEESE